MSNPVVQSTSDTKALSDAYMETYREFKSLVATERDIISRLRESERSVRQIRNEERELEALRQELSLRAKDQEAALKEQGLSDFDLTILRKRCEPQGELPQWLQFE